jgi:hypothetical protein
MAVQEAPEVLGEAPAATAATVLEQVLLGKDLLVEVGQETVPVTHQAVAVVPVVQANLE